MGTRVLSVAVWALVMALASAHAGLVTLQNTAADQGIVVAQDNGSLVAVCRRGDGFALAAVEQHGGRVVAIHEPLAAVPARAGRL